MSRESITIRLSQHELESIYDALIAKAKWLNENCLKGTGDGLIPLAEVFESAKCASISITYKL